MGDRKTYNKAVALAQFKRIVSSRSGFTWSVWTVFGCYSAIESRYQSAMWGKPIPWRSLFFSELAYAWIGALTTPFALALATRYRLPGSRWPRVIALHVIAGLVWASIVKLAWDPIYSPQRSFYKGGITLRNIGASIAGGLDVGFLLYWIVVIAAWALTYYRTLQKELFAASELRRQFATAQVEALRMQIHPHFLFNTLHTITGLLHEDLDAAERMIARLSIFLRHSLASARTPIVPLSEELEFVRLYLEIEAVRFEDRLQVQYEIDPDAEHGLVPNLILQPLVENAIRYAVARRTHGGIVRILARVDGPSLRLKVLDNGPEADAAPVEQSGSGVGLSNARERLSMLYGSGQQLFLKQSDAGTEVEILIPFQTVAAEPASKEISELKVCAS